MEHPEITWYLKILPISLFKRLLLISKIIIYNLIFQLVLLFKSESKATFCKKNNFWRKSEVCLMTYECISVNVTKLPQLSVHTIYNTLHNLQGLSTNQEEQDIVLDLGKIAAYPRGLLK